MFKSKPGPDSEAVAVDTGREVPPPAHGFTPAAGGDSYASYDNNPGYGSASAQGYGGQGYGAQGYGPQGSDTRQVGGYDTGGYAASPVSGYDAAGGTRVSDMGYGGGAQQYNGNQYNSGGGQPAHADYGADPRGYSYQDQSGGGYGAAGNTQGNYGQPNYGSESAQE